MHGVCTKLQSIRLVSWGCHCRDGLFGLHLIGLFSHALWACNGLADVQPLVDAARCVDALLHRRLPSCTATQLGLLQNTSPNALLAWVCLLQCALLIPVQQLTTRQGTSCVQVRSFFAPLCKMLERTTRAQCTPATMPGRSACSHTRPRHPLPRSQHTQLVASARAVWP